MASRSLGSLTVDLILKMGGFTQGLDKAARDSQRRIDGIKKSFLSLRSAVAGAFAGISVAGAISSIVQNTNEAEQAIAQLNARLAATEGVAGLTADDLTDLASSLQDVTTYGDDAIVAMQALLLQFTNIRGDNFKEATASVLDLATALGTDLNSAAMQLGKALDNPVQGLGALRRAGISFTESQKDLIKQLVETGKIAEAQDIILAQVEARLGGSAAAAANTFAGSIQQLQNAFGDLLEQPDAIGPITDSIQDLTKALRDPAVKQGFTTIVTGLVDIAKFAADTVGAVGRLIEQLNKIPGLDIVKNAVSRTLNPLGLIRDLASETLPDRRGSSGIPPGGRNRSGVAGIRAGEDYPDLAPAVEETKKHISTLEELFAGLDESVGETMKDISESIADDYVPSLEASEQATRSFEESTARVAAIFEATRTPQEKYAESIMELNDLLASGAIEHETYARAVQMAQDQLIQATGVAEDEWTVFLDQAARNTQDILGDAIYGAMTGRNDDILGSFIDMIDKMVAQALAAQLAEKLFGTGGSGGSGGLIGAGLDFLGGVFGGARAMGGPVAAGTPYLVGERGPEMFVPNHTGTIVPRNKLAGGTVNQVINVTGTVDNRTARQIQVEAARQQRIATARFG